jgi:hypothetical protein
LKLPARIYSFVALSVLLAISFYLGDKPYYNWDMFPYMAVVMDRPDVPFDSTVNRVYREAELRMPSHDYAALSVKHPELKNDPREFRHILKYYTIKPGYLLLVRFLKSIGFNLVKATYLPSVISYVLVGALLLWWLPKLINVPGGQIVALFACALPFMMNTARYSSPDMLSAFVFLAGVYLLAEVSVTVGLVVSALSIVVRPDMIILYLFVIQALYLSRKTTIGIAAGFSALGALITYAIIGFPGILGEFLFTHPSYSPAWEAAELLPNYLASVVHGSGTILRSQAVMCILAGTVVVFLKRQRDQDIRRDFWTLIVIACWITMLIRYLLHPVVEDRFLVTGYVIVIIAACQSISRRSVLTGS